MVFRHTLLAEEINQLRVAPVRLGKRIEHVAILKLKQAHDVHPRSLRLPVSLAGRSRLGEGTAGNDKNRN